MLRQYLGKLEKDLVRYWQESQVAVGGAEAQKMTEMKVNPARKMVRV